MIASTRAVVVWLINKKCFGGKHTSEKKLLNRKIKWLTKDIKNKFDKEYKELINKGIILRQKKRTGKSSDWHIFINPKKEKELHELLDEV